MTLLDVLVNSFVHSIYSFRINNQEGQVICHCSLFPICFLSTHFRSQYYQLHCDHLFLHSCIWQKCHSSITQNCPTNSTIVLRREAEFGGDQFLHPSGQQQPLGLRTLLATHSKECPKTIPYLMSNVACNTEARGCTWCIVHTLHDLINAGNRHLTDKSSQNDFSENQVRREHVGLQQLTQVRVQTNDT